MKNMQTKGPRRIAPGPFFWCAAQWQKAFDPVTASVLPALPGILDAYPIQAIAISESMIKGVNSISDFILL
jgi:hypothetical protein